MSKFLILVLTILSGWPANAVGDLLRQEPIEVVVELGQPGMHAFLPNRIEFETGRLYKLVLANKSEAPHYFTSHEFTQRIFTRKVQVVSPDKAVLAEFKGAIREVEVYPGQTAEWWLVPVATGLITDLHCGIREKDGRTHAEHGMVGEIIIR